MKLLVESNEQIAERQRAHEVELERARRLQMNEFREQDHLHHLSEQMSQRNLTYEFLERMQMLSEKVEEANRDSEFAIEDRRASVAEKYRREAQEDQNENDLNKFFDKNDLSNTPRTVLQRKVMSLIRRFNPLHKTLLIKTLYEEKLLHRNCDRSKTLPCYLELQGADLSELQLGKKVEGKFQIFPNE